MSYFFLCVIACSLNMQPNGSFFGGTTELANNLQ